MKIGIDIRPILDEPAGIGHYVRGLLRGFKNIKAQPDFYLYADKEFSLYDFKQNNFHQVIIKKKPVLWHFAVYIDALRKRLDIYHSTHSLILPSFPFIKSVLTMHDVSSIIFPQKHSLKVRVVAKLLFRLAARNASYIIVPSQSTKRDLLKVAKIPEGNVIKIAEGCDDLKIFWKKDTKYPYILFLGTLEPRKNVDTLIYAFKILRDKYKRKERLVIAGKTGWLYAHLFGLVESRNLGGVVEFKGYVSDEEKARLLSRASVFVFPSLYEGFGLPVLEALHVGVPVVTSNISSLPEVANSAAILVNPNDYESLAFHINRLLTEEKLAADLSRKGRNRAEMFSWEVMAKKTLEVYRRCV